MTACTFAGTISRTFAWVRASRIEISGSKPVAQSAAQAPQSRHSYMVRAQSASMGMPRSIMLTCRPLARGVLVSRPVTSCTGHR